METPEQVLAVLAEPPRRLAALTREAAPERLDRRPAPEEWSAAEVLAHLRSCGDVWGGSIARILEQDRPTFRAVNPRTWITTTDYDRVPFAAHLRAFEASRSELLAVLGGLRPDDWHRSAVVTGAGRPLELTVLSYAARLAVHERGHVKQIGRAATG